MLYKALLTFESVNEVLKCDYKQILMDFYYYYYFPSQRSKNSEHLTKFVKGDYLRPHH